MVWLLVVYEGNVATAVAVLAPPFSPRPMFVPAYTSTALGEVTVTLAWMSLPVVLMTFA